MATAETTRSLDPYFQEGATRAAALANRGPLRFDADGRLADEILAAYRETGFYVFEGVIDEGELAELLADLEALLDRVPRSEGAEVDRLGRPLDGQRALPQLHWAEALSDPWGGTGLLNGRHPVRMDEPAPTAEAPEQSIFLLLGLYEAMPSAFRLSAHPGMLRVAENLFGPDFVPYNDSIFLKEPGVGASVAWHQDGTTHWDNPAWHPDIHGVNFMAQLCRTTPQNALWVVPGSHREGRVDIPARVAAAGDTTRLPDAVPMLCEAGDIAICNRQCVHGSFANTSPDRRATFVWGFFQKDTVLDVEVDMPTTRKDEPVQRRRYTEEAIAERGALVQMAIEARGERRPEESAFRYTPTRDVEHADPTTLHGYQRGTIFI